ncbi:hypothetical protein J3L11_15310, partial [Shewanella sp. 4t3-1-2LB]|uniref:hypothetical protein n=1 Tax=Shewanella sp. 4t3-1-2LB TaxID=2817682 RepID=UPI001A984739
MNNIIAHRGFWKELSEQNSELAFRRAIECGFGIETDLRDFNEEIVISHNMANSSAILFDKFMELTQVNPHLTLALNIKADGLQESLISKTIANLHFYFDMSIPDMLGYKNKNL